MKLDINRLHGDDQQIYVPQVERYVAHTIESIARSIMPLDETDGGSTHPHSFSYEPVLSTGKNFDYDFRLGYATFELKCSNNPLLKLEVESNKLVSGLDASKADFYVFVNDGYSGAKPCWKLRIIPTPHLRMVIRNNNTPLQRVTRDDKEHAFYMLDPKRGQDFSDDSDGWVADLSKDDFIVIKTGFHAHNIVNYCCAPWNFNGKLYV